jgi:dipeptidyl aminopeptidase/acylaminoacyl peptidase
MSKVNTLIFLVTSLFVSQDAISKIPATKDPSYFVSAEEISDLPLESLRAFTRNLGQGKIAALVKYGVKSYNMVYKTHYKGQAIEASGLIFVPTGLKLNAPIISLQHGTTFLKDDAPSITGGEFSGLELFAAAGYIAIMPDFIGYGKSASVFHPYYDKKYSALTIIDMIKSAKEFLAKENVAYNDQLFLAGYSEGGFVTLAAAEEIETNLEHGLEVTAVAAGAGGYDLTGMLKDVTTQIYYSYPAYLAFVLMSYNTTYDWNRPLKDFFKPSNAEALGKYMDGKHDGWFINQKLTTNIASLFAESFYKDLKAAGGETELKKALHRNSIHGWNAKAPIRLYHGTKDEIIPFSNSETTLRYFKSKGTVDISLKPIPGGTHGSSFGPMMQAFIPWFNELAELR